MRATLVVCAATRPVSTSLLAVAPSKTALTTRPHFADGSLKLLLLPSTLARSTSLKLKKKKRRNRAVPSQRIQAG